VKRIKKPLKISLIIISTIFVLAVTSFILIITFFPKEKLLKMITTTAEKQLERKIDIQDIKYGFTGIKLKNITILNSLDKNDSSFINAKSVSLGFSPLKLLQKKFIITHINVDELDVEINYKDNKYNLEDFINTILGGNKNSSNTQETQSEKKIKPEEKDETSLSTTISYIKLTNSTLKLKSDPKKHRFYRH
jgi:uncharacterized protein involved in outer membrane biogenesis